MTLPRPWPLVVAFGAILALATVFALTGRSGGAADRPIGPFARDEDVEPPRPISPFLDSDGRFTVPPWDDRELSDEQKAADPPPPNPAWKFFGACVSGRGYELRADSARPYGQADMDALVARANRDHPAAQANFAIARLERGKRPPSLASAWLDCAEEWLTKTAEDIYKLTGEPNHWYPPQRVRPTPTPAR